MKGTPEACTRTPGAWLQIASRAVALGRSTGRGSCGSGCPWGASRQMRQARISRSRRASSRAPCRSYVEDQPVLGQHHARVGHLAAPRQHTLRPYA